MFVSDEPIGRSQKECHYVVRSRRLSVRLHFDERHEVGTEVNNVRNNGPELLEPLPPEQVPDEVDA